LKLKYLGLGKKTKYNGYDADLKQKISVRKGDEIEVSSRAGTALLNDFPNEWDLISGVSNPVVTSLEVEEFAKSQDKLAKQEKDLIKEKKALEKREMLHKENVKKLDADRKKLDLDKKNLANDRKKLTTDFNKFEKERLAFREEKLKK